ITKSSRGLYPYQAISGSSGFPAQGGGIYFQRNNAGASTTNGAFIIHANNIDDGELYYTIGVDSTDFGDFKTFASKEWITLELDNYVTKNTAQTINGLKTFNEVNIDFDGSSS